MPRAALAIDLPEGTWIQAVTAAHPDTVVRVVAVLPGPEVGTALAELRTREPVRVLSAIDGEPDVESIELLWQYDDRALVQIQTQSPFLLGPVTTVGIPLETPFDIQDGSVELSLTTSSDRLSALGDRLDAADVGYELQAVHGDPSREADRLSDRQRELLLAAHDAGYYETPRGTTLTELAASMGIAKATASDLLQRAERKLVEWYLEEHPVGGTTDGESKIEPPTGE